VGSHGADKPKNKWGVVAGKLDGLSLEKSAWERADDDTKKREKFGGQTGGIGGGGANAWG